jgi:chemotaxis protein MotB
VAADDEKRPIIIKKVKKVSGGHHGGAWKVAYADFVTAMMAFFLLLWLLNVTTDEQRAQLASYFSPADPRIAQSMSGSGGVLGGTSMAEEGALTNVVDAVTQNPVTPSGDVDNKTSDRKVDLGEVEDEKLDAEQQKREEERFKEVEEQIRQAIESVPELQNLAQNLIIDMTPEGLRIQIVDQEGRPMFPLGSAKPLPEAVKLLRLVSNVILDTPNKISVRGHTDSIPYGDDASYTNWELSADRANASRRVMLDADLTLERIENVMGKADRELLDVENPRSARNRRISIILLKESLVPGIDMDKAKKQKQAVEPEEVEPELRKKEEGIIYFP